MDVKHKLSRRDVIKGTVASAVVGGIAGLAGWLGIEAKAAEAVKLIDERKISSARALGFLHDDQNNAMIPEEMRIASNSKKPHWSMASMSANVACWPKGW